MENNYQLSRIHNYINSLMSKEEMHALEREALDDPFLQDAIDGYTLQDGVDAGQLSLLQKRLAARVETRSLAKNKRFYSWQRLAVGMAAAVLFVTVCTLLLIRYLPQRTAGLAEVEIMQDKTFTIALSDIHEPGNILSSEEAWKVLENRLTRNYRYDDEKEGRAKVEVVYIKESVPLSIKVVQNTGLDEQKIINLISKSGWSWAPGKTSFILSIERIHL